MIYNATIAGEKCSDLVKREETKMAQRQLDVMDYKLGQNVLWI
jgi:hypothetical protein